MTGSGSPGSGLTTRRSSAQLSERFPGVMATDYGLDIDMTAAQSWMQGWRP